MTANIQNYTSMARLNGEEEANIREFTKYRRDAENELLYCMQEREDWERARE